MEENQRVASYKEVSETLGKKLIKLYGEKIFPRQGKVFADMLFQTGVEAGTYIASLSDIDERGTKVDLATNAMVKLNQTSYIIGIMKEAGYYSPEHVADIEEYLASLSRAMRELLTAAFSQTRVETVRTESVRTIPVHMPVQVQVQQPKPVPAPKPIPQAKPAAKSAKPAQPFDPDGFSDPV